MPEAPPRSEHLDAAEAEKFRAEAAKAAAESEIAMHSATIRRLEAEKAERQRAEELAGDKYHHVYRFHGEVNSNSVKGCMSQLDVWDRLDPECEVKIVFNSPGGSVVDGMALWDYLVGFRKTHTLYTHAEGMAASMAGILLQAGDVRSMGAESYLLIHEVSAGIMGSFGDIEDRVKWIEMVQDRILSIFANRSKLSKATLKRRWKRKDWWLASDESLKLGFVDEVS